MSRTKAKKTQRAAEERPVFVESVPPAMVAEVFEVAGADDDVIVSSMPPPPERPHAHPMRPLSIPPAPHPPRPLSMPPALHRARPSAPPPVSVQALELAPDTLELAPEDLEPVESSSLPAETRTALLTPLPTEASVRPSRPRVAHRAWLLVGGVALTLGVAVGVRLRAAEPHREAPASAMVRPRATATVATASAQHADVSAPGAPNGVVTAPDPVAPDDVSPAASSASKPLASAEASSATASAPTHLYGQPIAAAADDKPFDAQAASAAITAAFGRAAACRGPNDPTGSVTATLTYAPSGRVTTATVSGAFAGTPIGGCIASALRGARVPPFSGERLTVRRTTELH